MHKKSDERAAGFHVSIDSVKIAGHGRFTLEPAGVTAIVGANNSGKSTFLRQLRVLLENENGLDHERGIRLIEGVSTRVEGDAQQFREWLNLHTRQGPGRNDPRNSYFTRSGWQGMQVDSAESEWFRCQSYGFLGSLAPLFVFAPGYSGGVGLQGQARPQVLDNPDSPFHMIQDHRPLMEELNRLAKAVFGITLTLDETGQQLRFRIGATDVPVPRLDEDRRPFAKSLESLPAVDEQGQGFIAFFTLFLPLITSTYPVIVVDEPEAYLHPPQAYAAGKALGMLAATNRLQVITATHDKDFLAGVLASQSPLSVARIERKEGGATVSNLSSASLRELWDQRLLRYSNTLSGLFHRLVVVCEGDQDSHFYQAALEDHLERQQKAGEPFDVAPSDVLFVTVHGKAALGEVARILKPTGVRTVLVPDLDILNDRGTFRRLVEAAGGDWNQLESSYTRLVQPMSDQLESVSVAQMKRSLEDELLPLVDRYPEQPVTSALRAKLRDIVRQPRSQWDQAKVSGVSTWRGGQRAAVEEVMSYLSKIGVVPVAVGSLESFAPRHAKGRGWLSLALEEGAHTTPEAVNMVERILNAGTTAH